MTYNAADHVSCLQEIDRLNAALHLAKEEAAGQRQAADVLECEVAAEQAKVVALAAEVAGLKLARDRKVFGRIGCLYCAETVDFVGDGADDHAVAAQLWTHHMRTCAQHPMRLVEAEVARLTAERDGLAKELRPEVRAFARLMEAQLKANDHKGGWQEMTADELMERLYEETEELDEAINDAAQAEEGPTADLRSRIGLEAADVANFCMMVADVCGALAGPSGSG